MTSAAKKKTLPQFSLTEVAEGPGENVIQVDLPAENGGEVTYYTRPVGDVDPSTGRRRAKKPNWSPHTFPLFPVVLNADGSPWPEANLWVIDRLVGKVAPNMLSYAVIAEDLAAFRRYIDEEKINWLSFPPFKLQRPTYRYNAYLRHSVEAAEISHSVARRRMGTVIGFYRWLKTAALFNPSNPTWVDSDHLVEWKNEHGFSGVLTVKTTDVSIKGKTVADPYSEYIEDSGKLRPLPQAEQKVLVQALTDLDNTEMSLIFLFSLFSGARIQTVLTVRVRHVRQHPSEIVGNDFRLNAGPGTGIDTKNGTKGVLHLPKWFYERLYIYAHSQRARTRREKADGGNHIDQHLFLSYRGAPMYASRPKRGELGRGPHVLRHPKNGQGVRQFLKEKLLPEMRLRLNNPRYKFRFHDLRATFGLNAADSMLDKIKNNSIVYTQALGQIRQLMWHSSPTTTEKYLQYRENLALFDAVQDGWNEHLANLAQRTLDVGVRVDAKD